MRARRAIREPAHVIASAEGRKQVVYHRRPSLIGVGGLRQSRRSGLIAPHHEEKRTTEIDRDKALLRSSKWYVHGVPLPPFPWHVWAMATDLTKCTGCDDSVEAGDADILRAWLVPSDIVTCNAPCVVETFGEAVRLKPQETRRRPDQI